jgi:hypothetical protein
MRFPSDTGGSVNTWTADAWVEGEPEEVLEQLTDPKAITQWSPVGFEILELDDERLRRGTRAVVSGNLAGRRLEFVVLVLDANPSRVSLIARGPVTLGVEYRIRPRDCGSEVRARVAVSGEGLRGRLLAGATEALLATGALDLAMAQIGWTLESAQGALS